MVSIAARRRGRSLLVAAFVAALSVQACSFLHSYPDPPATTYRPTLVGVIAELVPGAVGDAWVINLTDGRVVNLPDGFKTLGGRIATGQLYLTGNDPELWEFSLAPSRYSSCSGWEVYMGGHVIAWNLPAAVLFQNGLELPKAAGFQATTQPENVDGRSAWAFISGGVSGVFCVNEHGEVAFGGSGEPSSASPSRS